MPNHKSPIADLRSPVLTYLPLPDAARKYHISEKVLTRLIQDGRIEAAQLPSGELLVSEHDVDQSLSITRDLFEHLRGQPISASEASRKYSDSSGVTILQSTISRWAKAGYIKVLARGYRLLLDEADVAYCAAVYGAKVKIYGNQMSGVRIFDDAGNPYRLKYPEVARQMRIERHERKAADNGDVE